MAQIHETSRGNIIVDKQDGDHTHEHQPNSSTSGILIALVVIILLILLFVGNPFGGSSGGGGGTDINVRPPANSNSTR